MVKAAYTIQVELDEIEGEVLFGVEMNLGLQSGGSDDSRISIHERTLKDSTLGSTGEEEDVSSVILTIGWMPLKVTVHFSKPAKLWRMPVGTVSQSEGGVEFNYQNTCLVPLWNFDNAENGIFEVEITLEVE